MYSIDLAHIHDVGFGSFADRVGPQLAAMLRRHGIAAGAVVEIGCGSGAVAGHLTAAGFGVRAWDVSPAMVRLARLKAPAASFRVGSLATVRIPPCDAIVSVGEVVTYVPGGLPVLRRFFARAHDALGPGGLLIFDFIASARGRIYPTKVLTGRDWDISVSARFDAGTQTLTRRMRMRRRVGGRVRTSRETHRVRVYRRGAIIATLEQCGFRVRASGSFGRVRLMPGNVAIVARKSARV